MNCQKCKYENNNENFFTCCNYCASQRRIFKRYFPYLEYKEECPLRKLKIKFCPY